MTADKTVCKHLDKDDQPFLKITFSEIPISDPN